MKNPKKNIYHIILTSNGKQIKDLYNCASEKLINEKFKKLIEENKSIRFPVKFINIGKLVDAHYELYIIKNDKNQSVTKLKDENGKIINFKTNNENWIIYDRENYYKEETFWVYGYHPVFQRKTFQWIFDNKVKCAAKSDIKQILVFQNKLIINSTYDFDMVLCKNKSDCIRLYNELEKESKETKTKYAIFSGDAYHSSLRKEWFNKIKELTGWDSHKISRSSLRP